MDPRNLTNFLVCFGAIFLFLAAVPSLYDVVSTIAVVLAVIRLAEWMMTRTRRYLLHKTLPSRNKAVLITGCDSGFGYMVAERMDKLGYHVFAGCLDASGSGAKNLVNDCSSKLKVFNLDVTSDKSVAESVKFVNEHLGSNDLWAVVNNAGIAQAGEIDWAPMEDFERVYDINTYGIVRMTQAFLPHLQRSKGRVVNNTSLCAYLTCPGYVGYCMSKSAAVAFTSGLRVEMVKWGVKAISIEAFFYKTPLTVPEANYKMIEDTWNKATEEAKEKYGRTYLEAFKQSTLKTISMASPKTEEVIYCFVDAITAAEPLARYFPCHLVHKVLIKVFWSLPACVLEFYQKFQMPYFVMPAALTKKSQTNGVNGTH